ncbi:MAG: phosphate ABC transporter permease subunit PstC [Thermoplasmata archaeon]|nr:phosphate ABC transporter permease subunit PstC [Thermoplasmata archaeon]
MGRPSPVAGEEGPEIPTAPPRVSRPALLRRGTLLIRLSRAFHGLTGGFALGLLGLFVALVAVLARASWGSIFRYGPGFLSGPTWDPVHGIFGAWPFVAGTLVTSAIGLALAVPVALAVAVFLSELAPPRIRLALSTTVDLLAAVPSVVYGFWAVAVLVPLMAGTIEPGIQRTTGAVGPFSGHAGGLDVLTAGIVLAIMILPTISAVSREALSAVSRQQREAAMSLGATRWEATRLAVLGPARSGIVGAILLGLGRALGETIAVTLVIGDINRVPTSIFSPGQTISSLIAGDLNSAVAEGPAVYGALVELGLVLLLLTIAVNVVARLLIWRIRGGEAGGARHRRKHSRSSLLLAATPTDPTHVPVDRWHRRRAAALAQLPRRVRRRHRTYLLLAALCLAATVLAILPLASIVYTAVQNGGSAVVRPTFYTETQPAACNPGVLTPTCPIGGVGPQIEGTLLLLGVAALIAIPVGILIGVYLAEYGRNRLGPGVSFITDVMTGVPSILLGVFVLALFLRYFSNVATSAIAGSVALSILMLPLIVRTTEEALKTVPVSVRESALALGFPRHRVTLRVAIGTARNAIVTGVLLAAARAGGETAALILTTGGFQFWPTGLTHPIGALPLLIFQSGLSGYANWETDAWGATLLLLAIMLIISVGTRLLLRRAPASE